MKSLLTLFFALAGVLTLSSSIAIPDPPSSHGPSDSKSITGSKIEELKSQFSPKYRRVRVTYGTYSLPAFNAPKGHGSGGNGMGMGDMQSHGEAPSKGAGEGMAMPGMEHEGGMLDASTHTAPKPCSDCTLKYAKASLNYPDGTVANINTGAWLHHLTLAVVGPGREDLACPGGTMRIPKNMERLLAFHNDRNESFFGVTATDQMGFYLRTEDTIDLELMLKNELNVPKDLVFSIEWEFIPGRQPGWSEVRGLWMDIAPCSAMMSDIPPPTGKTQFTLTGPAWKSSVDGRLLNTVGHMHDGGLEVQILSNEKPVCVSKASYDGSPGYIPSSQTIAMGAANMSHISSYSPCIAIGGLKKGDSLALTASYDFNSRKPGLNKIGQESHVMGVAMVFVEVKQN
jgi:hypothetical protein